MIIAGALNNFVIENSTKQFREVKLSCTFDCAEQLMSEIKWRRLHNFQIMMLGYIELE
jgi:hypothetical protein